MRVCWWEHTPALRRKIAGGTPQLCALTIPVDNNNNKNNKNSPNIMTNPCTIIASREFHPGPSGKERKVSPWAFVETEKSAALGLTLC
jgi:hypothetical protein